MAANCNGSVEFLKCSVTRLRECLDPAYLDSKRVEQESDKENCLLSSIFFLANRMSKVTQESAEFDRIASNIERRGKASLEVKVGRCT
ncbi:MAG TPA: hypothetical protein VF172_11140 [Nitrososphaera sp.]|jgi:hypothetical protein